MTESPIYPDLRDASVFITGGGSGIGADITRRFLEQGSKVAFVQRSDASAYVDEMEAATGNRPHFMQCDITDIPRLKACVAEASERHGTITVMVNNAANDERHKTLDVEEAYWDRMIAINLKSYFFGCQAVIPGMQAAGGGSIINFSSISYMMGMGDYQIYTASNSGINAMSRGLAREFGADKIRVNALAPGWVLTERQKDLWVTEESLEAHLKRQCLKDTMEPADVADGVLFLASNASKMMTGQSLVIDGGVVVTG